LRERAAISLKRDPATIDQHTHVAALETQGGDDVVTRLSAIRAVVDQYLILRFEMATRDELSVTQRFGVNVRRWHRRCRFNATRFEFGLQVCLGRGLVPLPLPCGDEQRHQQQGRQCRPQSRLKAPARISFGGRIIGARFT